jgi:hypothetical protein
MAAHIPPPEMISMKPPRHCAVSAGKAIDVLQYEVMQEKAATLGRLTQAFERAFAALRAFEAAPSSDPDQSEAAKREALIDEAADALWCFVVQREACGLRNTEAVLRDYAVPAALRLRMGVARGRGP